MVHSESLLPTQEVLCFTTEFSVNRVNVREAKWQINVDPFLLVNWPSESAEGPDIENPPSFPCIDIDTGILLLEGMGCHQAWYW